MSGGPEQRAPLIPLQQALTRTLRMVTMLAVAISLLTVLTSGFFLMRGYARHNLELVAKQTAYTVEAAVVFNDATAALEAARPIVASEGVAALSIRRGDGSELARWQKPGDNGRGLLGKLIFPNPVSASIAVDGQRVGEVQVSGNANGLGSYLAASLLGALICIAVAWFGTQSIATRLRRTMVEPLQAIAAVASSVRNDRMLDKRAPGASIAEMDMLSSNFNALLDELQQWHQQLDTTHQALLHRASFDPLSGLPNRATFIDRVREAMKAAQRAEDRFAILFLDGDKFKAINDTFGHAAGDRVIAEVAARLSPILRVGDIAARMGGDEFAILVQHLEEPDNIATVAGRINSAMASDFDITESDRVHISVSIGTAIYPEDGQDVESLIRCADQRMYLAKNAKAASGDDRKD